MATRKQLEVTELLRREISNILLCEVRDPRVGFVTVTRVQVARDQRSAKVYVTVRGSDEEVATTMKTLEHARGHVQKLVGDRVKLRFTPVLHFVEDKEMREALRVDRLIEQVRKEQTEQP